MKKLLAFLLAAVMLFTLCACGNDSGKKDDTKKTDATNAGETTATKPTETKIYYKTNAAGSTITTVIVVPEEGETFPIQTVAPTEADTTTTTAPTFAAEEDNPFNDVTLPW